MPLKHFMSCKVSIFKTKFKLSILLQYLQVVFKNVLYYVLKKKNLITREKYNYYKKLGLNIPIKIVYITFSKNK